MNLMTKIGINGMGRIGRLVLRSALGGVTRVTGDKNANTKLEIPNSAIDAITTNMANNLYSALKKASAPS